MPPEEGVIYLCNGCRRPIEPQDRTTVVAAEQIHFPDGSLPIDGRSQLYHPGCWHGDTRDIKRRPWETGPR